MEKITGFDIWKGFGSDLEHPNIWIFEHYQQLLQDFLQLVSVGSIFINFSE